jgi:hypothetical protein
MPLKELTNLASKSYVIDTDGISVVNVAPGNSGKLTTQVWSVFGFPQEVAETPAAVLKRLGLDARFVKLTSLGGELWVNPESVSAFHAPFPGDNVKDSVRCMLFIDGRTFAALEDVQTVRDRLSARDRSEVQGPAKKAGV